MATETVTLGKEYFETLLRRARCNTPGADLTTPLHVPMVTIPKTDHDRLLLTALQYANLKMNLFRGGIADETLEVLIKDDAPTNKAPANEALTHEAPTNENGMDMDNTVFERQSRGGAFTSPRPAMQPNGGQDYTYGQNANYTPRNTCVRQQDTNGYHNQPQSPDEYSYKDKPVVLNNRGNGNNDSQPKSHRQQYDKYAQRSVLLTNLHEDTTHADIVDVVRGGMLLDIFLRSHDRTANVSFLEEAHAQEFFRHVKRYDLYVRGKRVDIRWNDRQFILPGYVANKIAIGATRNLVIQNCNPSHTEEMIRDDLQHIHNLFVIEVSFGDQTAHISTNSVHNAMFARTCMLSRVTYKGSKIEWDDDKCAGALERPKPHQKENCDRKKRTNVPLTNRFLPLNMNDEDGSADDDEHDLSGVSIPYTMPAVNTGVTLW